MTDKSFIKDVIYGLKHEYGEEITLQKLNQNVNLDSGQAGSGIFTEVKIDKAILLPINMRAEFARTANIHRIGYLEPGQREILIDNDDLGTFKSEIHDRAIIHGRVEEVQRVDQYEFGAILVTKS